MSIRELLDSRGFVVIEKVLDLEEIDSVVDSMWAWFRQLSPDIKRDDMETWNDNLPFAMESKGIIQWYHAGHQQFVWDVRQNPKVHNVFKAVWNEEKLLASFDGINFQMPPEVTGKYSDKYGGSWWHCDQGKKKLGFQCAQGFVNLEETTVDDGCFVCLPGSHKYHEEFLRTFSADYDNSDWIKLEEQHKLWYLKKGLQPVRVPCPKGGMVLWDSRTIHCNASALQGRAVVRPRIAIYTCMTPRHLISKADLRKKQKYFYEGRMTNHWPHTIKVFPKTPNMFRDKEKYETGLKRADEIYTTPILTELGRELAGF